MDPKPAGSVTDYARRLAGGSAQIQPLEINGLSAAQIDLPDTVATVIYLGKQAFILQGIGKTRQNLAAHRDTMIRTMHSFHALTAEERKTVKPLTLRVVK